MKDKCDWCFRTVERGATDIRSVQIKKWIGGNDSRNGVRDICKRCRVCLKGEYRVKIIQSNRGNSGGD